MQMFLIVIIECRDNVLFFFVLRLLYLEIIFNFAKNNINQLGFNCICELNST